jgi:hypothetical protein
LRPESLSQGVDTRLAESGARNSAVMITVRSDAASKLLLDDLTSVIAKCDDPTTLRTTALAPLFGHPLRPAADEPARVMLSPLNPVQLDVLSGAMSRQLTVATGPPGTGKTALVVSVIATAVAAGETVLVASTKHRAVDRGVAALLQRCARIRRTHWKRLRRHRLPRTGTGGPARTARPDRAGHEHQDLEGPRRGGTQAL